MTASRYTADIDLENLNTSHSLAILAVEPGSHVLDIGAADGSVARRLVERGCRVVGVEVDPEAARAAERFCERVIAGDVETLELGSVLDGATFDLVLLLDVLEHLHDPLAVLKAAAGRLKPGGRMIVSVPNVTHAAVRLQLLCGRFQYTDAGLLDRTHLHFFDRPALEQLVAEAGLTVLDRMRTVAGLTETEIPIDPDAFQADAVSLAMGGDDADTYQFLYVLAADHGAKGADTVSLGEALQRRAIDAERLRAEAETYVRTLETRIGELESQQADLAEREAEARERLGALEDELRTRMAELEQQHEELQHAKLDIAVKDEQLAQLHGELAPLRATLEPRRGLVASIRHHAGVHLSRSNPAVYRRLKRVADRVTGRGS